MSSDCEWCGDDVVPGTTFCRLHSDPAAPSGPALDVVAFRPTRAIWDALEQLTETGLWGSDIHETANFLVMKSIREILVEQEGGM